MSFGSSPPPVVVDASAAIEFLGGDADWMGRFVGWAKTERMLLTPAHFLAEVANGELKGRRLGAQTIIADLDRLSAAGVESAGRGLVGLRRAIELADDHGLTVYDALYLQLAIDVDGELATLDGDLSTAARAEGVAVID